MSNVFLAITTDRKLDLEPIARSCERVLPFVPENQFDLQFPDRRQGIWSWSVLDEAARGSFWAQDEGEVVVVNGWFAEDDPSLKSTVAEHQLNLLREVGASTFAETIAGDWSMLRLNRDGSIDGLCDFLGGQHLYYGQKNGIIAVSNRAFVCAAALNVGVLPERNPLFFSWLLTATAAPVGQETPFEDVHLLAPQKLLRVENHTISTHPVEASESEQVPCWARATHDFEKRVGQVKNLPDLRWALALTGGKDSRLVLSGLVAAQALERIEYAFLRSVPDHPDVIVGKRLADKYDLEFRLLQPLAPEEDFLETVARHNFQTEFALNAWDLRGRDRRMRVSTLHGCYGEIYRGHAELTFAMGWRFVEAKYLRRSYIDIADILTDQAHDYCHRGLSRWIENQRQKDTELLHLHDTFHRQMRMHRWMGQVQTNNACATVIMAPIPSASLLTKYRQLPLRDRQNERVHFELMRRCAPWLAKQPFANDRWSKWLPAAWSYRAKPLKKGSHRLSRQMNYWKKHGDRIKAFLTTSGSSGLFEIVDAARLNALLEHAGEAPDFVTLRAILAATAIRQALDGPLQIRPVTLDSE